MKKIFSFLVVIGLLGGCAAFAQMRVGVDQNRNIEVAYTGKKFCLGLIGNVGSVEDTNYLALGPILEYSFVSRSGISEEFIPYASLKTIFVSFKGNKINGNGIDVNAALGGEWRYFFLEGGFETLFLRDSETRISVTGSEPFVQTGIRFYFKLGGD
jgi:hypothetical protein